MTLTCRELAWCLAVTACAASPDADVVEGTFRAECQPRGSEADRESFELDGSAVRFVEATFADAQCTRPSHDYIASMRTASHEAVAFASTPTPLDLVLDSISVTPHDPSLISTLNDVRFCGVTGWALGVPMDITGKTCGDQVQPQSRAGVFTTYATEGTDALRVALLATTADGRPTDAGTRRYVRETAPAMPPPADCERGFLCNATGLYEQCYDNDGDLYYETCFTHSAFGAALQCERAKSEVLAVADCEEHRGSLISIGNIGGVARPVGVCTITSCSQ